MYVVEPALLLQLIGRHSLISICLGPGTRKPTWLRLGRRQTAEISHQNPSEALLPGMGEPVSLQVSIIMSMDQRSRLLARLFAVCGVLLVPWNAVVCHPGRSFRMSVHAHCQVLGD
jgi:hypothetical protein